MGEGNAKFALKFVLIFVLIFGGIFFPTLLFSFEVRVGGSVEIQASAKSVSTILQVSGTLSDETGKGLSHRPLLIRIFKEGVELSTVTVKSEGEGHFVFREEYPPGKYRADIVFLKTGYLDGVEKSVFTTLKKGGIDLKIVAPSHVSLAGERPVMLYGMAFSKLKVAGVRVPVLGNLSIRVNKKHVGNLKLARDGRGTLDIRSFLSSGINEVELRLPGSGYRDEVRATATLRVSKTLKLHAKASKRRFRLKSGLGIQGQVSDEKGPIPDVLVRVVLERKEKDSTVVLERIRKAQSTNDKGEFEIFINAAKLGKGNWITRVEVIPIVGAILRKELASHEGADPSEKGILDVFALFALSAGIFWLFVVFYQYFKKWKIHRKKREDRQRKKEHAFVLEEKIIPTLLSTKGAGKGLDKYRMGGLVVDLWKERNVDGAQIQIEGEGGIEILIHTKKGEFEKELEAGAYRLKISKVGYISGNYAFSIPHSGELSNFRIDLVPVPLKIRRLYEAITDDENFLGWGLRSPREIEQLMSQSWVSSSNVEEEQIRKKLRQQMKEWVGTQDGNIDARDLLKAISTLVEHAYFSDEIFQEEAWFFFRNLVMSLEQ